MPKEPFTVERFGAVARCSMNCPEKMNALSPENGASMIEGIGQLIDDETVSVIVIRGEGENFCTGADLSLLGDNMEPAPLRDLMNRVNAFLFQLHQGPKIVITEVDGYAFGGGLGLALASDMTVASEEAKFCCGFIRIGAVPDMGATYFLTERLGMAKAREIALTGDIVEADQALKMGLVNRVIPRNELSKEVMKLATRIAKAPPETLAWTKRNLNRARHMDLQTALDLEAHIQPLMLLSDEHKKAMKKLFS